jgi:DNA gyrase/topoisomerase IV subunit B
VGKRTKHGGPPSAPRSIVPVSAAVAVRRRPEMYLGPERRCSFLVAQAALEPFFADGTRCSRVEVSWTADGVVHMVDDDWSADTEPRPPGKTDLEQVLTYFAPGRLRRGAGLCLTNLMSEWFLIEVHQPARLYRQRFEVGAPQPAETGAATQPWRTLVTFKPDAQCVDARTPLTADSLIADLRHLLAAPESWHLPVAERPALSLEPGPDSVVLTLPVR